MLFTQRSAGRSLSRRSQWRSRTECPFTARKAEPFAVNFSYVYLLVGESDPARHYVALTDDLKDRLRRHNASEVVHTAKHRPWKIQVAVAFDDRKKASEFEACLKSHSGRAFAKRHF